MSFEFRSIVSLLVYDTTLSPGRCLFGKRSSTSILVVVVLPILTGNNTVLVPCFRRLGKSVPLHNFGLDLACLEGHLISLFCLRWSGFEYRVSLASMEFSFKLNFSDLFAERYLSYCLLNMFSDLLV
jgi:hypothetical protein